MRESWIRSKARFLIAGLAALLVFTPALTRADEPDFVNLPTLADAEGYAKKLLSDATCLPASCEFEIYHFGSRIPQQLEWIAEAIGQTGRKVNIVRVSAEEMAAQLDGEKTASERVIAQLSYDAQSGSERQATQALTRESNGIFARAKRTLKRFFGIPNGFTLWVKFKHSVESLSATQGLALRQTGLAALSMGGAMYLASQTTPEINRIAPTIALSAWVWLNMRFVQETTAVFGQARTLKYVGEGRYEVTRGVALNRALSFVRSVLTNAIVMTAAFGPESAFSPTGLALNLNNSVMTVFSKFWFDEWVTSKQATLKPDGTVVVEPGQWSPTQLARRREVFEFFNGLAKNLNLLGVPGVSWIFPASGIYGVIRTAYQDRTHLKESLTQLLRRAEARECVSVLALKR